VLYQTFCFFWGVRFGATDLIHALSHSLFSPLPLRRRIPCTFAPLFLNSLIGPVIIIITDSQATQQAGLYIIIITTTTTTISKVIDRVLEKHKQHLPLEVLIISLYNTPKFEKVCAQSQA
jgi:hypothetical protein